MASSPPSGELLFALGRLVRGLSALFWGIPAALVVCLQSAKTDWLAPFGHLNILPPMVTTGLLVYGLLQLGHFQKQERVWQNSLERAKLIGLVNVGFSPFVCWWQRLPQVTFYLVSVGALAVGGWLFLIILNQCLQRLAAMIPDETLRHETKLFTSFNLWLLLLVLIAAALYFALTNQQVLTGEMVTLVGLFREIGFSLIIFLSLLPIAMTMALIWKIKETIFNSVFTERGS